MTAPTLFDTLRALAGKCPKRVKCWGGTAGAVEVRVQIHPQDDNLHSKYGWVPVAYTWPDKPDRARVLDPVGGPRVLRAALEEECEARGWYWELGATRAVVSPDWDRTRYTVTAHEEGDATHRFALALLAALTAQETGVGS